MSPECEVGTGKARLAPAEVNTAVEQILIFRSAGLILSLCWTSYNM